MLFATVSEVAGLWKLALICAVVVLALLFQKQIRGVLDRGFRVRHRDTEIEAAPSAPIAPLGTGEEAEPEQPNQEAERVRDEGEGLELDHEGASPEDDADPTISSVIALLIGGEFEKAREVFDAVQAAEADATTRLQNQATFAL